MAKKSTYTVINKYGEIEERKRIIDKKKTTGLQPFFVDIGLYVAMPIFIGVWAGHAADVHFHTKTFYTMIGISIGILSASYNFYKVIQQTR